KGQLTVSGAAARILRSITAIHGNGRRRSRATPCHPRAPARSPWRHTMTRHPLAVALVASLVLAACSRTEPPATRAQGAATVAPAATVAGAYPTQVYFGDTHLHTALSLHAGIAGARQMPADAYRLATGPEVTAAS